MMKRMLIVAAIVAAVAILAISAALAADAPKAAAKSQSWTGEVVDLGCYLGHGAKGAGHAECGTKCVAGGMPMGLLVGANKVYVLTMNHDNADPYTALKGWVDQQVKVTGTLASRGGVQAIEVDASALAAAPAK